MSKGTVPTDAGDDVDELRAEADWGAVVKARGFRLAGDERDATAAL